MLAGKSRLFTGASEGRLSGGPVRPRAASVHGLGHRAHCNQQPAGTPVIQASPRNQKTELGWGPVTSGGSVWLAPGTDTPLPTPTSRRALEWPSQLWRDPSAIKTARLCNDPGAAHAAIEIVRVKSDARSQRLRPGQRLRIAPGDLCQAARTVDQIPIPRRAFPLAERAAACGAQKRTLNISQGQVERRRVRGLSDGPGSAGSSHLVFSPTHHDLAHLLHELGRAREVPHGNLSWQRNVGKRWAVLASPAPLRAGLCQGVKIVSGHFVSVLVARIASIHRTLAPNPGLPWHRAC